MARTKQRETYGNGSFVAVTEYAVDEDYIAVNPCRVKRAKNKGVTNSGSSTKKRRALSEDEAASLCEYLDETEAAAYKAFAEKEERQAGSGHTFGRSCVRGLSLLSSILATRLILATGMRRGEALGITWGSIDLKAHTVRVSQTLNETMDVKVPKTDNGIRNLYVDVHTVEHLKRWKAFQARYLHLVYVDGVALNQDEGTPAFCTDNGSWMEPTNYSRWWRSYRRGTGLGDLLTHELRHAQVTILKAYTVDESSGVTVEMIKQRVGHARETGATAFYTHEMPAMDKPASDVMGRILYENRTVKGAVAQLDKTA